MNKKNVFDKLEQMVELAGKLGASASKMTFHQSVHDECEFENGRLKNVSSGESVSYAIKTLVDGKIGAASGNVEERMEEMLTRAITMAKIGSTAHFTAYPPSAPVVPVQMYSERTAALETGKMMEDCKSIIDVIEQAYPDLFICASAGKSISSGVLVTSGGVRHSEDATAWSLGAYTQRTEGSDMLFTHYGRSWRDLSNVYDPGLIAGKNLEDLHNASRTAPMTSGRFPVLLDPRVAGMFLGGVFMGVNGKNVAKGDSPLCDKLGEQVLHESLTIIDDPHLDYSSGSCTIDNDGIPTGKQTIFDKGVLKMFLYDYDTAGLAGTAPTGNNACAPYSPEVRPGMKNSGELLTSIKDGLYVKQLIGFGQSNIMNGDFSANVGLGFRIHDGHLAGRVKNVMISGNIYDVLGADIEVSSDRDLLARVPYILANRINVSAGAAG